MLFFLTTLELGGGGVGKGTIAIKGEDNLDLDLNRS